MAMLLDAGMGEQVRGEALHLAFLAVASGIGVVVSIIGFLLRRDLRRSDKDKEVLAAEIVRVDQKVDSLDRRHGYEIADIKIAVAPLFTKSGLEQPEYPSR